MNDTNLLTYVNTRTKHR